MDILQKLFQPNLTLPNMLLPNVNNITNNESQIKIIPNAFCVNCGSQGHYFKSCLEPVCSYGLICFYKKKTLMKEKPIVNNINNRKTKKTGTSLRNNKNKYVKDYYNNVNNINNVSKIKILKRHESVSYTLKNMLGVVGGNSDEQEAIDGILDTQEVEEIIEEISAKHKSN